MKKTFEDFKQEVAEKYKTFNELSINNNKILNEAANLWGQYCTDEAMKVGIALGKGCKQDGIYNQGWNDALHWAAENVEFTDNYFECEIDKDSILKHLKQTDSNKEE